MKLKILIPVILLWAAVLYLCASFIFWDFNPAKWELVIRVIVVALFIVGILSFSEIEQQLKTQNKEQEADQLSGTPDDYTMD